MKQLLLKKILFWFNPGKHLVASAAAILLGMAFYFYYIALMDLSNATRAFKLPHVDYSFSWQVITIVAMFIITRFGALVYDARQYSRDPSYSQFFKQTESDETVHIKEFFKSFFSFKKKPVRRHVVH